MSNVKEESFEKALERLERIAARLEAGDVPLEKGVALYKEGMGLLASCRKRLAAARLAGLDPLGPLVRGYSLATVARTGRFLRREGDVRPGDKLDIMVYEGRVRATVDAPEAADAPDSGEQA